MLRITVRKVTGDEAHLEVPENLKLSELKQRIEGVFHLPLERQRLIYLGRNLLNDNAAISEMGISNDTVVHLVERSAPAPGSAASSGSGNNNSAQQNTVPGRPPFMMPFGPLRVESVTGQFNFPAAVQQQQQRLSPLLAESSREHRMIRKLTALLDSLEDALGISHPPASAVAPDYRLSVLFPSIVNRITALHMLMFRMHVLPLQRGIQNQGLVRLVLPIVTKMMNIYDLFVQNYIQNFDRIEQWTILPEVLLQAIEELPERVSLPNRSSTNAASAAATGSNNPPVNGPSSTPVNAAANPIASMLGTFVTSFTQDGNAGRAIGNVVSELITSTVGAVPTGGPGTASPTAGNTEAATIQSSNYQSSFQNQRADVPVQSTSYDFGKHGRFLSSCLEGLKDDLFQFFDSEKLNSVPLVKSFLRSACRQVSNQEWSRLIDGDYRILSKVARCFKEVVTGENVLEFVNQIERLLHSELISAQCDVNVFMDTLIRKCNVLLVIAEHNRENRLAEYTLFCTRNCVEDLKNNLNHFDLFISNLFHSLKPLIECITDSCRIEHLKELEDLFVVSNRNSLEQMLRVAMEVNEINAEEINAVIEKIPQELGSLFEHNVS